MKESGGVFRNEVIGGAFKWCEFSYLSFVKLEVGLLLSR